MLKEETQKKYLIRKLKTSNKKGKTDPIIYSGIAWCHSR